VNDATRPRVRRLEELLCTLEQSVSLALQHSGNAERFWHFGQQADRTWREYERAVAVLRGPEP